MKKNAIVIMNLLGFPQIVWVNAFNDESVKMGLAETLKVDIENIECLSKSTDRMIYGIKEKYPQLENALQSVNIYYSEYPSRHAHYVHVIYAQL